MKKTALLFAICGCSTLAGSPAGSWDLGALAGYRGYDSYRYGRYDRYDSDGGGKKLLLRGGCYLPVAGSEDGFEMGWLGGLAVSKTSTAKFYELGVDYILTESSNGRTRSSLYVARAALGKAVGASFRRKGVYYLAGLDFVLEDALDTFLDESNTYWSIDLDLGLGWRKGKLDLRMSYLMMLATENVPGALLLSAGLLF